jgi:nucleotide-binding universal stress UspA family protein
MPNEPFGNDDHLNEYVGMFEAAAHALSGTIVEPTVTTILLACDGSNQDDTARRLAKKFAGSATIAEIAPATDVAAILQAATSHQPQLIVIPVPYGHDYAVLKGESLGSTVDMLLLESPCPVLCVRDLLDEANLAEALSHPLIPATIDSTSTLQAAGWAFRAASMGGRIRVLGLVDEDVLNEAKQLIDQDADAALTFVEQAQRAINRELGSAFATIQQEAYGRGIEVGVETVVGRFVPAVEKAMHDRPHLVIWGRQKDHNCPSFHRAADLILASRWPVLIY